VAGKSSAVADVAAQAGPDQGRSVAHTPAPAGDAAGDLLGFEAELDIFAGQTIAPPAKRGPGRPPGSVNRTTLQLQRLLMARGGRDPAEFLSSLMSMDARDLARQLSEPKKIGKAIVEVTSVAAALDLQVKAAKELLPYFHQKMPLAIQHSGEGLRPVIVIHDGPQPLPGRIVEGEAMSVHDEQYQGLSEGAAEHSHGDHSHDGANDE
jgi:hypothetical protein